MYPIRARFARDGIRTPRTSAWPRRRARVIPVRRRISVVLPEPLGPEQAVDPAGRQVEGHAVHGRDRPEPLDQTDGADCRLLPGSRHHHGRHRSWFVRHRHQRPRGRNSSSDELYGSARKRRRRRPDLAYGSGPSPRIIPRCSARHDLGLDPVPRPRPLSGAPRTSGSRSASRALPPLTLIAGRLAVRRAVPRRRGRGWRARSCRGSRRQYGHLLVMSVINIVIPFTLITVRRAVDRLRAGLDPQRDRAADRHRARAAVPARRGHHASRKVAGLAVGFAGVILLVAPDLVEPRRQRPDRRADDARVVA